MDKYKNLLKDTELEELIAEVTASMKDKFDENALAQIDDKKIKKICKEVYDHSVYSQKKFVMGINKAVRDIRKTIIKADKIYEGFYIGGQDQINPRKEEEPSRQTIILWDDKAGKLEEITVFGHGATEIIDGKKTSSKGEFVFGTKYKMYCTIYPAFGTYTGNYMEKLKGKFGLIKFHDFLTKTAVQTSELSIEDLYKVVVVNSPIKYSVPLEIKGEDKSKPKKELVINGNVKYDDKTGLPIMVHEIVELGKYPIATNRLDDRPELPCFTARVKLWREDVDEVDEDFDETEIELQNYTEVIFYPQRLGQTRVSIDELKELIFTNKILTLPPEEQFEIFTDEVMEKEILTIGKISQFNKDKTQPINWVKINGMFVIDSKEMEDTFEELKLTEITSDIITESIDEIEYDGSDEKLMQLKAILTSDSVLMLGETNYDELKQAGRLDVIEWIDDSYRDIVNSVLKKEGRFSL